ncbi:hypothetical protein ACFLZ1_02130 [Patescibacteria group bacterium]
MKEKEKKSKKSIGSTVWLIIFLGIVVFGIAWIVGYNKHLQIVSGLVNEVNRLNQEIEKDKKQKPVIVKPAVEPVVSATPSASQVEKTKSFIPSQETSTVSADVE